jgi:hypothetical protein
MVCPHWGNSVAPCNSVHNEEYCPYDMIMRILNLRNRPVSWVPGLNDTEFLVCEGAHDQGTLAVLNDVKTDATVPFPARLWK